MEKCRKCGAELRSEQKVCIRCGLRTIAGGNYDVDEKKPLEITRNMIYAASGVALLLIIVLVVLGLRTIPPDVITKQWFGAMVERNYGAADQFHSQEFSGKMEGGISDTGAISDFIYDEVNNKQGKPTFGAPIYDNPSAPTEATVHVTLSYSDGSAPRDVQVIFAKFGRRWLISKLNY